MDRGSEDSEVDDESDRLRPLVERFETGSNDSSLSDADAEESEERADEADTEDDADAEREACEELFSLASSEETEEEVSRVEDRRPSEARVGGDFDLTTDF